MSLSGSPGFGKDVGGRGGGDNHGSTGACAGLRASRLASSVWPCLVPSASPSTLPFGAVGHAPRPRSHRPAGPALQGRGPGRSGTTALLCRRQNRGGQKWPCAGSLSLPGDPLVLQSTVLSPKPPRPLPAFPVTAKGLSPVFHLQMNLTAMSGVLGTPARHGRPFSPTALDVSPLPAQGHTEP